MGARLSALITAALLTGLIGPAVLPAAAEDSAAPSDAAASSAGTASPTAAAGTTNAAENSQNGPVAGPSHVGASNDQPTGGPDQEAGTSADAAIGNNAAVGQSSGQAQGAGTGANAQAPGQNGSNNGQNGSNNGQGNQQAQTGQQADAGSHAAAQNPQNESNGVRVGNGNGNANGHDNGNANGHDNGNGNGVGQQSSTEAEATATTSQETNQDPRNGVNQASGTQGASAAAHSEADRPSNDIVNTRIEAHGDDRGFDQSITSDARAEAANDRAEGNEVAPEARATAVAELRQPENAAVEVRLFSDGDTTGGIQTIAATAAALVENGGPNAAADATATVTSPTNTFVSLRVNSEGTTGDVTQEILRQELEVVDGESIERAVRDLLDSIWSSIDLGDGISISLAADGANTDLRITIENDALLRPSAGTTFLWTWDLVFGPGGDLDCALASSLAGSQVTWNFDCDPTNRLEQATSAAPSSPRPAAGAISWSWDWDRPELQDWSWQRDEVIPIPTCGLCTYVFDFNWLSFEPETPAPAAPAAAAATLSPAFGVTQVNDVSAAATASATSRIDQLLVQTQSGTTEAEQQALQQAQVVQVAEAQAGAELTDAVNYSVDTGGLVAQTNIAHSEAEALITAAIVQEITQQLIGDDSFQAQLAVQSATTTQEIVSAGTATLRKSANVGVSLGGTSTQSASSVASAAGVESAATRQVVEQEQTGSGSDQEQIAGQWAVVVQQFQLLAGAALADTRNESSLREEASTLRIESEAEAAGSSTGTIDQIAIQLQNGDTTALQQESLQQATIEQVAAGLAAATTGGFALIYRTPPPQVPFAVTTETIAPLSETIAPLSEAAPSAETAAGEPVLLSLPLIGARLAAPLGRAVLPKVAAATVAAPRQSVDERPDTAQGPLEREPTTAAVPAPLTVPFANEILASPAGTAGSVPSMTEDAEKAAAGSSGPPCLAPASGASAATAGNGSGSAFCALSGYALSPLPRLGRRIFAPAGRRPAAVVLLNARPG